MTHPFPTRRSSELLAALLPLLVEHGVAQLEQPLPRGAEADLDGLKRPLPFVARKRIVARRHARACRPLRCRQHQARQVRRSEEHTSELQSLMRISYAVFCLKKKKKKYTHTP